MYNRDMLDYIKQVLEYKKGQLVWKYDPDQASWWNGRYAGKPAGCVKASGYMAIKFRPNDRNGLEKTIHLPNHRITLALHTGRWPKMVDHINGDITDNTIENLREVNHAQNSRNRGMARNNTSGYKGVSWDKGKEKWRAQITVNNERIHVGWFDDTEEAAAAYREASRRLHGEYRRKDM